MNNEPNKRWRSRNPAKAHAHSVVWEALRYGRLIPKPCELCGSDKTHAHHDDYSQPLAVRWLCPKCHKAIHASLNPRPPKPKRPYRSQAGIKRNRPSKARPMELWKVAPKYPALRPQAEQLRRNGLSYSQIAAALKTSQGTIYKWLNHVKYE